MVVCGRFSIAKRSVMYFVKRGYHEIWPVPPNFHHVTIPEYSHLPVLESVPVPPNGTTVMKRTKKLEDIKGPELIHNRLLHKQYGIIALSGCQLHPGHITMIRTTINKGLVEGKMFAVWRIDPPWKPITKKGTGKRLGGGKGNISSYVTPIRAGRVIVEVGGKVEFDEVKPFLQDVVWKLPCNAIAVSEEIIAKIEAEERKKRERNINPLDYDFVYKNNIKGVQSWASPYHFWWKGKFYD